jgi:hypothetical protein
MASMESCPSSTASIAHTRQPWWYAARHRSEQKRFFPLAPSGRNGAPHQMRAQPGSGARLPCTVGFTAASLCGASAFSAAPMTRTIRSLSVFSDGPGPSH